MGKLTAKYALVQGPYWMGLAVIMSYASPYLLSQGFTNEQIGILIAAAGLSISFLQPMTAAWADDPQKPSPWHISLTFGIGICLCAVGLLLRPGLWFVGGAYLCAITLLQTIQPLINSIGMSRQIDFGLARGIGSVCFALMSYALGKGMGLFGSDTVPAAMLFCFLLFTLAILRYPIRHPEAAQGVEGERSSPAEFVRKYPRFCVALLGCVFTYISHVLLSNFTFQIVQSKGGAGMEMGTVIAIAALAELPTMFLFGQMRRWAGCDTWLRVSGLFFFLRVLGTLLCPSVGVLYAVQVFQMLGWALMAVNSVYYADSVIAPEDAVKGQAYSNLAYTVASVVGNVAGGALLDRAGAGAMLLFGTLCAGIGMVVIAFSAEPGRSTD